MTPKKTLKNDDVHLWRIVSDKKELLPDLRKILATYAPATADELQFAENENGKPYLSNIENLHFNLSHSRNLACIAVSGSPIGVDLEFMELNRKIGALSSRTMNEAQLKVFESIKDDRLRLIFFYQYWTFFEALVKALGETQFSDHPLVKNLVIENPYGAFTQAGNWNILRVRFQEGFATAVATQIEFPQITLFDYFVL